MITLKNVSKNIVRDGVEKNVLNNINIQLGDTGLVVIRGGNNSGKTYLLRILSQVDNITSGNLFVDGVDLGLLGEKELENYRTHYVGSVMNDNEMMENITIEENIRLGTAFGRVKPKKEVMQMLYDNLELTSVVKEKAKNCTPTQRICAEIGRLMIKSPRVLVFDDFEDTLQADTMLRVWRLLKEISQTHLVVIVSDSQPYISKFADRVISMADGKVVSDTGSDKRVSNETPAKEILDKSIFLKKHRFTLSSTNTLVRQVVSSNWKKMLTTLILMMIVAIGFVASSALSVFNMSQTLAKSSVTKGESYIEFYKGNINNRKSLNYDTSVGDTVIADLQAKGLSFLMAKHEVNWSTNIGNGMVVRSLITNSQSLKVGDTNKFGQELLAGKYTGTAAVSNDEAHGTNVVISDYMAEVIIQNGIIGGFASSQNVSGNFRNLDLYNALCSADQSSVNFKMNGTEFHIVGIYKTDFDKYVDKALTPNKDTKAIFDYNLDNIYSVIHVNTHFYTINPRRIAYMTMNSDDITSGTLVSNTFDKIIPTATNVNLYNGAGGYAVNYIGDVLTKTDTRIVDNRTIYVSADIMHLIYSKYHSDCPTIESFLTKYGGSGKTATAGSVIDNATLLTVKLGGDKEYRIAGFVNNASLANSIFVTGKPVSAHVDNSLRSEFEYLYIARNIATNGVVLPVKPFTTSEVKTIIDTMVGEGYSVNMLASEAISKVGGTVESLRLVFILVSIALSVVMALMILRYIKRLFMDNTKTWGLVRAFGCTKVNLNATIAIIVMISVFIASAIGVLFGWLITLLGNAIMLSSFGYAVSIFSINGLIIAIFAVLMIAVAGILVPYTCVDFQNLQPLYMIKYDKLVFNKKVMKLDNQEQTKEGSVETDQNTSNDDK